MTIGLVIAAQSGAPGLSGFYASASPSTVSGSRTGAGVVTSTAATVTAHGGTAPYTYAWTNAGGDSSIAAVSLTSATSTFSGNVASGDTATASMKCTVTDSTGGTPLTTTAFVSVHLVGAGVSS